MSVHRLSSLSQLAIPLLLAACSSSDPAGPSGIAALQRNAGPERFQSLRTLAVAACVYREGCAEAQALPFSAKLAGLQE